MVISATAQDTSQYIVHTGLTMLPSRDSRSLGREGEGRMVGEGRELGLGRVGAATSTSIVTGSAWVCRYKLRCRYRWS